MDTTRNEPRPHRWTREQYYQMLDLGWFQDQRVELIDGEVIDMPPQKNFHALAIKLTETALNAAFGPQYWVRVQMTLDLTPLLPRHVSCSQKRPRNHRETDHFSREFVRSLHAEVISSPDPDLAVVAGSPRNHAVPANPTTALLVVEISDTTLWYDRNRKSHLYAAAGIADYWIVNIPQRQLEVYRDPVADSTQLFGYRYNSRNILDPPDKVSPLAAPHASITVADLLP